MSFEHADCEWDQIGPCVYCTAHDARLYQGQLPKTDEAKTAMAEALDALSQAFATVKGDKE